MAQGTWMQGGGFEIVVQRKRRSFGGLENISTDPTIQLSNSSIPDSVLSGATVGELSVANSAGSYTYSLVDNPGGLFSISGSTLKTAASLSVGSYPITVRATGTPTAPDRAFLITVTSTAGSAGEMFGFPFPMTKAA